MYCYHHCPLHEAATSGDVNKVRNLFKLGKYNANVTSYEGHLKLVRFCKSEFKPDPNIQDRYGNTPLHCACSGGHLPVVRALVSEFKADYSKRNKDGLTAVMKAADCGCDDVVLAMLSDYHCPVNDVDKDGWGLLHYACNICNIKLVHMLVLHHKADIYAVSNNKSKPLDLVLTGKGNEKRKSEMVTLFVSEFSYDPNTPTNGNHGKSLLHFACQWGDAELVQNLLDHKADVSALDDKYALLILAIFRENSEMVQLFVTELGYDCNKPTGSHGKSLLHFACQWGDTKLIQTLFDHKADIYALDSKRSLPLDLALSHCEHSKIVELFVTEFGYDPNIPTGSHGKSLIHFACQWGDVGLIRTLKEYKADISNISSMLLDLALSEANPTIVELLVCDLGYDPNTPTGSHGKSLLHFACQWGDIELIQTLFDHKADIYALDSNRSLPVDLALSHCEDSKIIKLFVTEFGYDPNTPSGGHGKSFLHFACQWGDVELIHTLIDHKANIYALEENKSLPLDLAVSKCNSEILQLFVSKFGYDPNLPTGSHRKSLLHYACQWGDVELAQTLIDHKADVNALDDNKQVPLDLAIAKKESKIVQMFVTKLGYDPNTPTGGHGKSLLHFACQWGDIELIRTLMQYKDDVNAQDNKNITPLDLAVSKCKVNVILLFIEELGYNPNICGIHRQSLLHFACQWGDVRLINILIKHKADINALDDENNTPLDLMLNPPRSDTAEAMLSFVCAGYNPNAKIRGKSLLHYACEWGNVELILGLIKHKADVNALDKKNRTPLDLLFNVSKSHTSELEVILSFVCAGYNSNGTIHGIILLHYACKWDDVKLAETLLEHKADIS